MTKKHFLTDEANEILEEVEDVMEEETKEGEERETPVPQPPNLHYYFGLRCAEIFQEKHGRLPGIASSEGGEVDTDADDSQLASLAATLLKDLKIKTQPDSAVLKEIVRSGGGEVHNIASVVGGIGSQEALKFLVGQYIPVNNTIIFNGIHGSSSTYEL